MKKTNGKNLIVTGIPRSGTTLTTSLIDGLENSVCLSEPGWQGHMFKKEEHVDDLVTMLEKDFINVRKKILSREPIKDRRNEEGLPVTNYIKYNKDGKTIKNKLARQFSLNVENGEFLLGMKHNAHYTSILPALADSDFFSIIAVVRHPITAILSWQKVNFPISRGRLPGAERFWPEIKAISDSDSSLLVKQVKIYDLICSRYLALQDKIYLLKYEQLVKDPSILEALTGKKYERNIAIQPQMNNSHYNLEMAAPIGECLERYAPHALKLYPQGK